MPRLSAARGGSAAFRIRANGSVAGVHLVSLYRFTLKRVRATRNIGRHAVLLGIAAAALLMALGAIPINRWSLKAEATVIDGRGDLQSLAEFPRGHLRAELWYGNAALAQGNVQVALGALERAVESSPSDPRLLAALGRAYEVAGRMQNGVSEWKAAGAWQEMIRAGQRAIDAGRWDDALLCLNAAQPHLPREVVENEAQALNGQGDRSGAIALLQQALESFHNAPQEQKWRMLLGDYLGRENRWADAEDLYRAAISSDRGQDASWAHIGLGRAFYFEGKGIDAALAEIQRGIALDPNQPDGYEAEGDLLRAEKRFAEADNSYSKAVQRDPGDVWIVVSRVDNLLEADQAESAVDVLKRAIKRFPTEAHLYYQLGEAYKRLGDLGDAVSDAEMSVSLDTSRNPSYRLALASLYEQTSRQQEAVKTYRSVLSSDPNNSSAKAGLIRLGGDP